MTVLDHNSTHSIADTLDVVDAVLGSFDRRLPAYVSRADLASAGKLALVEALMRFDGPASEARAYCYVRVRGAVVDELRRQDPLSRHTRNRVSTVQRATQALERQLGRAPTSAEVSGLTGFTSEVVSELDRLGSIARANPVDEADGEDLQALADPEAPCPARLAETGDAHASIRAALERLAPNHAHVLRRYYLDDATLDDIAVELGVSKERVRQLRESAEKKLREDFIILALWQSLLTRR